MLAYECVCASVSPLNGSLCDIARLLLDLLLPEPEDRVPPSHKQECKDQSDTGSSAEEMDKVVEGGTQFNLRVLAVCS